MSTPMWDDKLHVRTSEHARRSIDRLRLELRSSPVRFWGKRLTQEALVAALLMWAESQGAEEVAKGIKPFLVKLEALMGFEATALRGKTKGVGGRAANGNVAKKPKRN